MSKHLLKDLIPFTISILLIAIIEVFHLGGSVLIDSIVFMILLGTILYVSMAISNHAEELAIKFGEPYGTMILTITAVLIEIILIIAVLSQTKDIYLARDTIFAAIMFDINGILGISAIIGGLKYGEQKYNVDSTNSYISMTVVVVFLGMVTPYFLEESHIENYLIFIAITSIFIYIIFLRMQTVNHKYMFQHKPSQNEIKHTKKCLKTDSEEHDHNDPKSINAIYHVSLLIVLLIVVAFMAELLGHNLNELSEPLGLPIVLSSLIVAFIAAAPELITTFKAAYRNQMQTVINIAFGATLSTVSLTIPAVIIISAIMDIPLDIKLTIEQMAFIGITFFISFVNAADGETNSLEGFAHVFIFIAFMGTIMI